MKLFKPLLIALALLGIFSSAIYAQNNVPDALDYERVIDGDTFVASGITIRLWGIDAPEKDHPVSYAATLFLETMLKEGTLSCQFMHTDRYKRSVMMCFVDNYDISSQLVRFGMAKDYKKYSNGYYNVEESIAEKNNSGLWKYKDSEPI